MADTMPRKSSLGFFNPFKSRKAGSGTNSRASSVSDFGVDEVHVQRKSVPTVNRLRKEPPRSRATRNSVPQNASVGPQRPLHRSSDQWERDAQTGERKDHTDMLHSLAHRDSAESLVQRTELLFAGIPPQPGSQFVARFPPHFWDRVADRLDLADAASLAFANKTFRRLVGTAVWQRLNKEDNHDAKTDFLGRLDKDLPDHLLCFPCATYHVRTQKGRETLRPTNVANPIFNCPNAFSTEKRVSRTRITVGRSLPFPFAQLMLRAHNYSSAHGIASESMSRRYKDRDSEWTHQTRYAVVNRHLLLRVVSSAFAEPNLPPAGLRKLLYSPNDNFCPFFSVCAHWRDGELMPAVKCALSHIPSAPHGSGIAGAAVRIEYRLHRPNPLITLCPFCRPMRRCPDCASEYLIELRMQEDKTDPSSLFKYALVLTRWSDLGDGSSPRSPEWAACNGNAEFDSFTALGRRAISGVFESQFTVDQIPPQKIITMNPAKEKRGEAGHSWY